MKTRGDRKTIVIIGLTGLLAAVLFASVFTVLRTRYARLNEERLAAVAKAVLDANPETSEKELLSLLRDPPKTTDPGLFRKYGLLPGETVSSAETDTLNLLLISGLLTVAFLTGAGILLCVRLRSKRQKELSELLSFLDEVEKGAESLHIRRSDESEYSLLTKRLYDLTVRLRESAAVNRKHGEALVRWLQDVSHQIRTPLTSAVIMLDALSGPDPLDEETRREFSAEAARQLDVIQKLIEALLKISKIDAGAVAFKSEPVCARALLCDAKERLGILFDIKNIKLEMLGDLDVSFPADRNWQTEALTNILKNCAEHSKEGQSITAVAENTGAYLRLTVSDQGDGIDETDLPHIFERFYKAKNAGPTSVGIGLSLAKQVIEAQNGYIGVRSEKGRGTRFVIGYKR